MTADGGAAEPAPEASSERRYWRSLTTAFLLVSAVVAVAGLLIYLTARGSVTQAVKHNLQAIASLKAAHLDHWLDEQMLDTRIVLHAELARPEFAGAFGKWLRSGMRDDGLRASLLADLRRINEAHQYLEINLRSGHDGSLLLASDGDVETAANRDLALASVRSGKTVLEDFQIADTAGVPKMHVGFLHALGIGGNPQDVVVAEVRLDASQVLFPTVEQWPGWNLSEQTRLLRRRGNTVAVLDGTHKASDQTPALGISSAAMPDSAGARAIKFGVLEGDEPGSRPVFAYALPVPHTPWTLVAEVSKADAYAKLNTVSAMTAAIAVLLMLYAGWWLQQQKRGAMARARHEAERKRLATRIDFLARYANDCIVLCDASGRIMEVNDRCPGTYGYSPEELLQMNMSALHAASSRDGVPQLLGQIPEERGLIHESTHEHKDGTAFDVEMSTRRIDIDGKPCYQAIIRDISERKRHQAEREAHLQLLGRLTSRLVSVQEEERRHLSAELHDQLGANLATMNLNLRTIARMLPTPDPRRLEGVLTETGQLLADSVSSIRDYCADLRPAILDYSGLGPALKELAQRFARNNEIAAHFRHENMQQRLSPQAESMLFRIAQEALTNCAKHSQASAVELALFRQERKVVLTVSDDGCGFDPQQLGTRQVGMGLLTMSERAVMAGGVFSIRSSPGKGTCITVELLEDPSSVGLRPSATAPADPTATLRPVTAMVKE